MALASVPDFRYTLYKLYNSANILNLFSVKIIFCKYEFPVSLINEVMDNKFIESLEEENKYWEGIEQCNLFIVNDLNKNGLWIWTVYKEIEQLLPK